MDKQKKITIKAKREVLAMKMINIRRFVLLIPILFCSQWALASGWGGLKSTMPIAGNVNGSGADVISEVDSNVGSLGSASAMSDYTGEACSQRSSITASGSCSGSDSDSNGAGCGDVESTIPISITPGTVTACKIVYWANAASNDAQTRTQIIKIKQYITPTGLPTGADQPIAGDAAKTFTFDYTANTISGVNTKGLAGNTQSSVTATPASVCQVVDANTRQINIQSDTPKTCYVTISLSGNGDVAPASKTFTVGMAALQTKVDNPYPVIEDNQGVPLSSETRFSTNTPTVCDVEEGYLTTRSAGDCVMRAYEDYANNPSLYSEIIWTIVADTDYDSVADFRDNCPFVANNVQEPSPIAEDENGDPYQSPKGAACVTDKDGDGVLDNQDNCPLVHNTNQAIDTNTDAGKAGFGTACASDYNPNADQDSDGIINQHDNCSFVANGPSAGIDEFVQVNGSFAFNGVTRFNASGTQSPSGMYIQKDTDQDGVGNVCDKDVDGDGVANDVDNCPYIANVNQQDSSGNGVGDACGHVFVKPTGDDNYDCSSWDLACKTISEGISVAKADSNISSVFIAGGNYTLSQTLPVEKGVTLYAGFDLTDNAKPVTDAEAGQVATTLSVTGNQAIIEVNNQGMTLADEIRLSNITLTGQGESTAMRINNSRVILQAVNFENNGTATSAAALAVEGTGNTQVIMNGGTFSGNTGQNGAGVSVAANTEVVLSGVQFTSNQASKGAAIYQTGGSLNVQKVTFENNNAGNGVLTTEGGTATVNESSFKTNTASGNGGAIVAQGSAQLSVTKTEFVGNGAVNGGAIALAGLAGNAHSIVGNLFEANTVSGNGGALHTSAANTAALDNNVFYQNKALSGEGGALYLGASAGQVSAHHNTMVANEANIGGAASSVNSQLLLKNNLIAGNTASNKGANLNIASGVVAGSQYNLIGESGNAGIEGATPTSTTTPSVSVEKVVELQLGYEGGDGYFSSMRTMPIIGGGPARDMIAEGDCAVATDMRGEVRPDTKSANDGAASCDAGAYEFTVLSCVEDAQRRFDQGGRFIKTCVNEFSGIELNLGSMNYILLSMLALLGFSRRKLLNTKAA